MYELFYGFRARPFNLSPDPSFYLASKQHRKARAYLDYGVSRNEGFIVITGEIGAGKTTVLRSLIDSMADSDVVVGHVVAGHLDDQDVLRMVGTAFGVSVREQPKALILANLEAFLLGQATQGRRCLLVVDEAQNLTPRAVEELRMLSNFQYGNQSLLQSFLVGQPEFRRVLQQPDMEQFRQRVAATCHIGPLEAEEVRAYIVHRLSAAGGNGLPTLDDGAFEAVHASTGGIPRRINALMDRLLLGGYLEENLHFEASHVLDVAQEIRTEGLAGQPAAVEGVPILTEVMRHGTRWSPAGTQSAAPSTERFVGQSVTDEIGRSLVQLEEVENIDRIRRLEESLLRLEQINRDTLQHLRTVVMLLSEGKVEATLPSATEPVLGNG